MKVYIAASWTRSEEAKALHKLLVEAGHEPTSTWYNRKVDKYDLDHPDLPGQALLDVEEVIKGQTLICITGDTETKGGRHTELGYALALRKDVILWGPREQVFHHLPGVMVFEQVEDVFDHLNTLDCQITENILLLVDEGGPAVEDIKKWTNEQRLEVELWGGAIHFAAADNRDDCKVCNATGKIKDDLTDEEKDCETCEGEGTVEMEIPPRPATLAKWPDFGPK